MDILVKLLVSLLTTIVSFVPKPSPTPIPTLTPKPVPIESSIYQSKDDPDTITQYYKNIFIRNNSKVKSFVITKTNGNVLNKLSGTINNKVLNVEIKKAKNSILTTVTLSLK